MNVVVTNLYVRFLPTIDQIRVFDSLMNAQGLDLFDTPLDYQILQEGDYYQDPTIDFEQPTWQYAVVPANFSFPSGIQSQVLAQIHIPTNTYEGVETEAERLASLVDNSGGYGPAALANNSQNVPNIISCTPGFVWDPVSRTCVQNCPSGYHAQGGSCVPNTCPSGYYWNGTSCVAIQNTPPPYAADASIPSGHITVDDTQLGPMVMSTPYSQEPVRRAMIIARRWFKIERTTTDDNGNFVCTKHFKHKVKISLNFMNSDANITFLRGVRFWEMYNLFGKTIGVYSSNKNSIAYNFTKYENSKASVKGNVYWTSATTLNAIQEYKEFAVQEGIGLPADQLKILLTSWMAYSRGATPMYHKRLVSVIAESFINSLTGGTGPLSGNIATLTSILAHNIDIAISFKSRGSTFYSLPSEDIKSTIYHELTHAAEYVKFGNAWYEKFVNAEITQMTNYFGTSFSPYGPGPVGTSPDQLSPIIALGESWAYHIGEYFTDKRYGLAHSYTAVLLNEQQSYNWANLSCHLFALEEYDPKNPADQFKWIPIGVYYDLMDDRNDLYSDPYFPKINDQVSGYTNQQMFNAFGSSIGSMQDYKANLLLQNSNNQSSQVLNLFQQYGY